MFVKASAVWTTAELERKLHHVDNDINNQIAAICDYNAAWGTTWMKVNAPWTDDTGAARSSLFASAASQGTHHEIVLAHGVHYGIWLEVANSGRFQIIGPAMRVVGNNVMKSIEGLLDGKPPNIGSPVRELPPVARKAKPNYNKSGNRRSRKQYGRKRQT